MTTRLLQHRSAERLLKPLLQERDTWLVVTLFWSMTGAVAVLLEYGVSVGEGAASDALGRAGARAVYAGLWWALTLFAIWISERATLRRPRQYGVMLFHAVAGALIAVLWAFGAYRINLSVIPGWQPEGVLPMLRSTYYTTYLFYLGVVGLAHGVILAREHRARELEARSRELESAHAARLAVDAQLQVLKMELQPHFLFNTLNAISALMHRNVDAANEMLVLLADMLAAALANVREQEVTLGKELETLGFYVRIQQIRFGDRLNVVWSIDPEILGARVPHLILQPIVENAIVHGIGDRSSGGSVEIRARRNRDRLELFVRDDGQGAGVAEPGFGMGLSNTRARLEQLYGEAFHFHLIHAPGGGSVARLSLPFSADAMESSQTTGAESRAVNGGESG